MSYFIAGKQIQLSPKKMIAQGGEADIYIFKSKNVIKLFKSSQHPSFANDQVAQQAAAERLVEHQTKLAAFPTGLPKNVLQPEQLVRDDQGQIVGYTMPYVQDSQPLYRYGDRRFREQNGIEQEDIIEIFIQLHHTLSMLHQQGIVIGDFNDLNILIKQQRPYFIDTDSWQFSSYLCKVFTPKFVDPILCDPTFKLPNLVQPYTTDSDWYAFSLLLFKCLLYVDLYGGIYADKSIPQAGRSLLRLTVFHPKVKYPKPALAYDILPIDLIQYFKDLSEKDLRGVFPLDLLTSLTTKNNQPQQTLTKPISLAGKTCLFQTQGIIIATQFTAKKQHYLYWEQGEFKRETGETILRGDRHPDLRFWLDGDRTYIAKQGTVLCFLGAELKSDLTLQVDQYQQRPCFATQAGQRYWLHQGKLWGDRPLGQRFIGDVLEHQSYFWLGETTGFGLYQARHWLSGFSFQLGRQGINDQLELPKILGTILESACYLNKNIWLFLEVQYKGQIQQHLIVFDEQGKQQIHHIFSPTEILDIYGFCALNHNLYLTTDTGLQCLKISTNEIQWVAIAMDNISDLDIQAGQNLVATLHALYLWDSHHIYQLPISSIKI